MWHGRVEGRDGVFMMNNPFNALRNARQRCH